MTSSRDDLYRLGPQYGINLSKLEDWQWRLCDLAGAWAVILLKNAVFEMGLLSQTMIIPDEIERAQAKRFISQVAAAKGFPITFYDPIQKRPKDAPGTLIPEAEVIMLHVKQPPIKIDRRTLPETKEKHRQAQKARHMTLRMVKKKKMEEQDAR